MVSGHARLLIGKLRTPSFSGVLSVLPVQVRIELFENADTAESKTRELYGKVENSQYTSSRQTILLDSSRRRHTKTNSSLGKQITCIEFDRKFAYLLIVCRHQ